MFAFKGKKRLQKAQVVIIAKQNEMFYVSQRKTWGLLFSFILSQPFLFTVFFLPTETIVFPLSVWSSWSSRAPLPSGSRCSSVKNQGKRAPDLPCEGLRDMPKSRISPFPSRTLVFPAVPWFSLGAAVAALPWDGEDAPELSLLLLQVLHPPTPSQVLQLPGLLNLGFKAYL